MRKENKLNNMLEKLKERIKNMESNENKKQKSAPNRIEEADGRKIYYTEIFEHLTDFRILNKELKPTF